MSKNLKKPLCVISKETFGEFQVRDIQTNSTWIENPYGDEYAIVPDEMIDDVFNTCGYCDITLNKDGTEIISFIAREIPHIEETVPKPSQLDVIESQVMYTAMMTDTLLEV